MEVFLHMAMVVEQGIFDEILEATMNIVIYL